MEEGTQGGLQSAVPNDELKLNWDQTPDDNNRMEDFVSCQWSQLKTKFKKIVLRIKVLFKLNSYQTRSSLAVKISRKP